MSNSMPLTLMDKDARIAELEADAARYRWLSRKFPLVTWGANAGTPDDMIDAAMRAESASAASNSNEGTAA